MIIKNRRSKRKNPIKQPGNYFTAPPIYDENCVQTITVTAHWKEKSKYTVTLPENMELAGITSFTADRLTLPDVPYLDGYDFTGWKVNGTEYAADVVKNAVETYVKEGREVTVQAVYSKKTDTYCVYIGNGHFKDSDDNDGYFTSSTQLYAVANEGSPEQIFQYWTATYSNGNTVIVSYNECYAFRMPTKDMILSAVYGYKPVEETAKVGTAYIESVAKTDDNSISFVAISSVPDGATMKRTGIVAFKSTDINAEHPAPTIDYARFKKYNDTTCQKYSTFKYTWTKGNIQSAGDEWCVCAYLVYTDKNGVDQTILQ